MLQLAHRHSLSLSLFLSQPTFKVTTCAEKYQSLDNEILISWWWYQPPSSFFFLFSSFFSFFFFLRIFIFFDLIEDRSMPISLSDRESINFCESGSKERESACHVHKERDKGRRGQTRIIYALNWPSKWRHFRARDIISLPLNVSQEFTPLCSLMKLRKRLSHFRIWDVESATFFLPGI